MLHGLLQGMYVLSASSCGIPTLPAPCSDQEISHGIDELSMPASLASDTPIPRDETLERAVACARATGARLVLSFNAGLPGKRQVNARLKPGGSASEGRDRPHGTSGDGQSKALVISSAT